MVEHAVPPEPVEHDHRLETPDALLARSNGPTYAALDLGTNNCRLLIAAPTRQGFRVIDSFSRIVRLGEGLHSSGRLSDEAMDRTIGALHACASRLGRRRLRGMRAVATEACRRAENGRSFLDRVRQETGLSIDVISTREEAELALESCAALLQADLPDRANSPANGFDRSDPSECYPFGLHRTDEADRARSRALLFDIGGGSTEIAWIRVGDCSAVGGGADRSRPELVGYQSLPLGVITLAELFGDDAFTQGGYEAMVEHVSAQLKRFEAVHCIGREVRRGAVRLLGTSGTVTTLASMALGLRRYRRALVDGVVLSRQAAHDAIAQLRALGPEGLRMHGCVGSERSTYVLPGCAIFDAIHRLWPTDNVVVADRGLRDGMLLRMMRDRSPMDRSQPYHAPEAVAPAAVRPPLGSVSTALS
ncbi:Ppx/GppA family phosphatase [Lichenicola cladoniae]|uniref:Ppx/GppA family phosphatase n=1 Tax=Lichenicola cladoniae TaxID=1484109 RepID=A0A6M8HWI8_9PROT|nr:Ppx/GppA family phosphatase [Acetobacteraceae bacterium]QKE92555.1 Ppx/GppA family phosphatase [Lichenicola cladoniae]